MIYTYIYYKETFPYQKKEFVDYAKYVGFAGAKSTHFLFKLDSKKFHGFFFS